MNEFKREDRYLVFKRKHIELLTNQAKEELANIAEAIKIARQTDIDTAAKELECVVVESDWPIYHEVWEMIQKMGERLTNELTYKTDEDSGLIEFIVDGIPVTEWSYEDDPELSFAEFKNIYEMGHKKIDVKQLIKDWNDCPIDDGFTDDHPILQLSKDVDKLRAANAEQHDEIKGLQQENIELTAVNERIVKAVNYLNRHVDFNMESIGTIYNEAAYEQLLGFAEKTSEQNLVKVKADAIHKFVNPMIDAFQSGFTDTPNLNLAQLHRIMQNHIKDTCQIDIPHITEEWGKSIANECGFDVEKNQLRSSVEEREFINSIISELFNSRWIGSVTLSSIENMREQLHKTLTDQMAGYWSGHTAYHLVTEGGFLLDGGKSTNKTLTPLGHRFMDGYAVQLRSSEEAGD